LSQKRSIHPLKKLDFRIERFHLSENLSSTSYLAQKLPLRISNDLPKGGYRYFLGYTLRIYREVRETPPTNLPSVSKLQHRRVSFRYFEQHSHGVHVMVRGLHLCQFYECNASRPDISLTKKK